MYYAPLLSTSLDLKIKDASCQKQRADTKIFQNFYFKMIAPKAYRLNYPWAYYNKDN